MADPPSGPRPGGGEPPPPGYGTPPAGYGTPPPPAGYGTPPRPGYGTPPPGYAYPPPLGMAAAPSRLGGFWIRFAAYLIDVIPFAVVGFILAVSTAQTTTTVSHGVSVKTTTTGPGPFLFSIVFYVYLAVCWATWGQTLGLRALGMRVVDADSGGRISAGRAIVRAVGFWLSGLPLALGLIWAGWDRRKQGWHDKMASTVVIRES